ncbi:uncharacterized protein MJAP1_001452 [Malassezia japonica]|uniref:NECAP PHear domain-containing protein n=1 Tax=Malassezia japonica TaxID=223818 RepID=A0AAF0F0P6_9BASI|nr:uncharacterized protein MJAP1_001452 [Malassezia japonica]WFD38499.1 hypothetical protein MJAP1_001452 [Malassezia japonica]
MSEEYSSVLFVVRECYVYRVPPRTSAAGYRAGEWGDVDQSLWKGRMRIVEYKDRCEIRLEDGETGELFAASPYDVSGKSVEPVLDSSRYFVLRVESDGPTPDQRRTAYIGVGFMERSESFDFTVALQDWTRRRKAVLAGADDEDDEAPPRPSPHLPAGPKQDFSLQEGETLSIKLPALQSRPNAPSASATRTGFVLPPPPSGKR